MRVKATIAVVASIVGMLLMPLAAEAQGIVGGAENGAAAGRNAAGPIGGAVGGVVGGAVGGAVGGVRGVLGLPRHRYLPGYRTYRRHHRYLHRRYR